MAQCPTDHTLAKAWLLSRPVVYNPEDLKRAYAAKLAKAYLLVEKAFEHYSEIKARTVNIDTRDLAMITRWKEQVTRWELERMTFQVSGVQPRVEKEEKLVYKDEIINLDRIAKYGARLVEYTNDEEFNDEGSNPELLTSYSGKGSSVSGATIHRRVLKRTDYHDASFRSAHKANKRRLLNVQQFLLEEKKCGLQIMQEARDFTIVSGSEMVKVTQKVTDNCQGEGNFENREAPEWTGEANPFVQNPIEPCYAFGAMMNEAEATARAEALKNPIVYLEPKVIGSGQGIQMPALKEIASKVQWISSEISTILAGTGLVREDFTGLTVPFPDVAKTFCGLNLSIGIEPLQFGAALYAARSVLGCCCQQICTRLIACSSLTTDGGCNFCHCAHRSLYAQYDLEIYVTKVRRMGNLSVRSFRLRETKGYSATFAQMYHTRSGIMSMEQIMEDISVYATAAKEDNAARQVSL